MRGWLVCSGLFVLTILTLSCGNNSSLVPAQPSISSQPSAPPTPTPTPSSPPPASEASQTFVYVVIGHVGVHGTDELPSLTGLMFKDEHLTLIPTPQFPGLFLGVYPIEVAVSPRSKLLYVVDKLALSSSSWKLRIFRILDDGNLSEVSSNFQLQYTESPMAVTPNGKFLFIPAYDGLHEYRIEQGTDLPTELAGSPFSVGDIRLASTAVIDPSGKYLYVSRLTNGIWGFALNSETGRLTDLPKNPLASGFGAVTAIEPSGHFLYVHLNSSNPSTQYQIYAIASDGELEKLGTLDSTVSLWRTVFDPLSHAGYLTPAVPGGELEVVRVNSGDGRLQRIPGSPFSFAALSNDGLPCNVYDRTVDTTQRLLYASACSQYIVVARLGDDSLPQPQLADRLKIASGDSTGYSSLAGRIAIAVR